MNQQADIVRLRKECQDRKNRFSGSDVYSWFNPANLFMIQQRQRAVLKVLRKNGFAEFPGLRILEIGCGGGGVLTEFLNFGGLPKDFFGVDLLPDRLAMAHSHLPESHFFNTDGQYLPFTPHSFDLVVQFTALSSILDLSIRERICREMLRVVRSSGLILWYDFWLNPTNPQTRGIRPSEVRHLFPECAIGFQKITLAPPVARLVVPISWMLAVLLEKIKIFNSHYLAAIRPNRLDNGSDAFCPTIRR